MNLKKKSCSSYKRVALLELGKRLGISFIVLPRLEFFKLNFAESRRVLNILNLK